MFMIKKTPYTKGELRNISGIAASRNARIEIFYPDMEKIVGKDGILPPEEEKALQSKMYLQGVADICRETKPINGLMGALWLPNQRNIPLNDDRPYLVGSGLISKGSRYESPIGGLYRPLLAVMGILAFVFVILPFVVRRPGGGGKVRIDPRLLLILPLSCPAFH